MKEPVKPKYYFLRSVLIPIFFPVVMVTFLTMVDTYIIKVSIVVAFLALMIVMRLFFDPNEIVEYKDLLNKLSREKAEITPKVDVNANIKKYVEEQRIKKQNAKWWQIWI